jgi:hypothetical protein
MTSLQTRIRQNGPQFFMPLSSLVGVIYAYNPTANTQQFSVAPWADGILPAANTGTRAAGKYISSINGVGAGLLKDLGKSVTSAGRVFRKVQLVVRQTGTTSTNGVEGNALSNNPNSDYLTGYVEFGFDGSGTPAPLAQYGTL